MRLILQVLGEKCKVAGQEGGKGGATEVSGAQRKLTRSSSQFLLAPPALQPPPVPPTGRASKKPAD